jgi:hypothetical protein
MRFYAIFINERDVWSIAIILQSRKDKEESLLISA